MNSVKKFKRLKQKDHEAKTLQKAAWGRHGHVCLQILLNIMIFIVS